ncbi:monocarboxylate transporter 10-like [Porites lutea]|uniref:monocarboxylate transporter 10-like n=1 Tax=Porites lutea TaxID=51062 RepID=UPI003CC5E458
MKKLLNKIIARNETKKRDITALEICTEKECPDGGYGWIICIAAAICQFIIMGIHNNFGILYTYFMRDLKADPADTTWVGSIAFGVTFFGGPIASNLCERFGCRLIAAIGGLIGVLGFLMTSFANSVYVIYFTYSVVWGFGSSLSYATTTFVIGQYFDRNLALANGIITGGSGIGAIAMGPFYHLVLSNLGWKIMLRILSGFAFLMFVSALLYRPLPAKYKRAHIGRKERAKLFDLSVWKIKPFVFWVVSMSLLFFGYFVPFIHLPNFAEILGVPESKASLLIGYLSIASTLSRVLFGFVLNHPRVNRFYVLQFPMDNLIL